MCGEHSAVRGVIDGIEDGITIIDMGASPEPFARGTVRSVDRMVMVAEPYFKALEAAARYAALARDLGIASVGVIGNKARDTGQTQAIMDLCSSRDLTLWGILPHDDIFARADLEGVSPFDLADNTPGLEELAQIADRLFA